MRKQVKSFAEFQVGIEPKTSVTEVGSLKIIASHTQVSIFWGLSFTRFEINVTTLFVKFIRVKTDQWAVFESHVHPCEPQYKSTGVNELLISCINLSCYTDSASKYSSSFDTDRAVFK